MNIKVEYYDGTDLIIDEVNDIDEAIGLLEFVKKNYPSMTLAEIQEEVDARGI